MIEFLRIFWFGCLFFVKRQLIPGSGIQPFRFRNGKSSRAIPAGLLPQLVECLRKFSGRASKPKHLSDLLREQA